jgi:2-polyprenyl-3-methyl-5-hydroxy-6-metoxy-1,4-benzoquinol methylase
VSQYSDHAFDKDSSNNSWINMLSYIKDGSRVLDVGCSSGALGEELKSSKNCHVVGVDLDEADIKQARKKLDDALVADIDDESIYEQLGKFDVLVFADVIEHLVQPRETLKKVKKLLNKDGVVVFSIPNMSHASVRLGLLSGRFPYQDRGLLDRTHLHFYDNEELNSVFSDANYKINQLNPVVSKFPERLVEDKLKSLGLSSTDKFSDVLTKTGADIFQFVGVAVPTNKKTAQPKPEEYIMPQDEIYAFAKEVEKQKNQYHNQIQELNNKYTTLVNKIKNDDSIFDTQVSSLLRKEKDYSKNLLSTLTQRNQELALIKGSRKWRLLSFGSKIKSKIRRVLGAGSK